MDADYPSTGVTIARRFTVNVAERLEMLCDAGEAYLSAVIHDQVEGKIAC